MAQADIPESAPGTALFPQFQSDIYQMVAKEVRGLTDEVLDFESDRWEWSKWSIRRNLSHVASGDLRWIWVRWGEILFPNGLPNSAELDFLCESPQDRRLDESLYWRVEDILPKLRLGLDLCWSVLSKETVKSLREKVIETPSGAMWGQYPGLFPGGIRDIPGDTSKINLTLEATFIHRYYEYTTHLYNIQRLKRAQGVETQVDIPEEGYWVQPDWDRSEA